MKIEFDLPNFEKEISINIIIRKDGEVVYNQTTSPSANDNKITDRLPEYNIGEGINQVQNQLRNEAIKPDPRSGNFMDPNLF